MTVKLNLKTINELRDVVLFHRKHALLSRDELAGIAGIGKTTIYDIEHGKESVKLSTVLKVLQALNITIELSGPLMTHYEDLNSEKG